jgi:Na+-transporting NADH:ubiquinone oxidoreductase subunit B
LWGIYNTGYHSLLASGVEATIIQSIIRGAYIVLPIVAVSYGVGFFWETVFAVKRNHGISEGLLVTGILFPLTLPPTIPLWQVAAGISFGVVLGKEIFGGTGRNFLNPALTGRAFIFFAYPSKVSGDTVWIFADKVDALTGATPLAISGIVEAGGKIESALTNAKYSFATLFEGLYPGSIGETSALLCLIGAVFLVVTGVANYRIIAGGIIGVLATGFFLNFISDSNSLAWFSLNPFYHLVTGGFAFGITYMATDPVSAPGMDTSRWIYGLLIGVLTVLVRVFNPAYVEGTMLSILFMNALAPVIDNFVIGVRLGKRVPNV